MCFEKYPEFPTQKIRKFHDVELKTKPYDEILKNPNITAKPLLEKFGIEFNNKNKCMVFSLKTKYKNDMCSTAIDSSKEWVE